MFIKVAESGKRHCIDVTLTMHCDPHIVEALDFSKAQSRHIQNTENVLLQNSAPVGQQHGS